jgi:hypothetical protein
MQRRGAHCRQSLLGLATSFLLMLWLGACGGMSETERAEHEYADAEFQKKFIEDRDRCQASGRTIVINGDGARLDRNGVPKVRVNYYCARMNFE